MRHFFTGKVFPGAFFVVCMAFLMSCGGKDKFYFYNWTYYTPHTVIEKFEKEYNCEVIYDEFDSNETMYAKLRSSGGSWDVVIPSGEYVSMMIKQDMLAKIDRSLLHNYKNIDPEILARTTFDPEHQYSIPYYWSLSGVCVNTEKVPDYQTSWSLFARKDLAGKMTMLDESRQIIGAALRYLGYSVNSTKRDEIFAARDLIQNQWKPNLGHFDSDSFGKNYANGEFWVVQGYPEGIYQEIQDNKELQEKTVFFIPDEGSPSLIDSMCILKGARNIELAHKFIDFIHRPEIYAEFCDYFRFPSSVNIPARQFIKVKPMYDEAAALKTEVIQDVGPAIDYYNDAWLNTIRVGG